jgi:hypothetical protein
MTTSIPGRAAVRVKDTPRLAELAVRGSLAVICLAGVVQLVLADWTRAPSASLVPLSLILASPAGFVTLARTRWVAAIVFAWAVVSGLALAGLGAPPEPWAGDAPPIDAATAFLSVGGPRVAVGVAWVIAGVVGLATLAALSRRRRQAISGSPSTIGKSL